MDFTLSAEVLQYLKDSEGETMELLETLSQIPAPSWKEEKRAEFCRSWLEEQGAQGVKIDSALNVLYPLNCEGRDDIILFMAHTDTVFPDMETMPFHRDETYAYAPGVGDDTACLTILLMVIKYIVTRGLRPSCGILFAANAGEEGLGNLKGIKQIMKDYEGRIRAVYSFDGEYSDLVNRCVGSERYAVTFETEGGHSFNAFGNQNAIHRMAELLCRLYDCEVPVCGDSKTTYNVGVIEGGTSVNTIAQSAKMLYEYRSDSRECLEKMRRFFEDEIARARAEGHAKIQAELIGQRPCGGEVDEAYLEEMSAKCIRVCEKHSGVPCSRKSGSTDCNIPMSLGVPAVCPGLYLGSGMHTREEKVRIDSIPIGLKIAAELILEYFE